MDIRQLRCFNAVLTTGAMTRAANLLGLTQPTVSITIAQLEREIGFALFKRSKGSLEPTPEAHILHEAALQALDSVERVRQLAREMHRLSGGELSILCYPGIAWSLMPELITRFRADHPNIRTMLVSRSTAVLRQLILAQNYDVAIFESPVGRTAIKTRHYKFDCVCALPRKHALAKKDAISPFDLDGLPIAALSHDHTTNRQVRRAFATAGTCLNVALECDFFVSAVGFVNSGGGFAIVDPITAAQISSSDTAFRPFFPAIEYEIVMVCPTNRPMSLLANEFHDLLGRELERLQGRVAQEPAQE